MSDPLSDVLATLRVRAGLFARFDGGDRWAVSTRGTAPIATFHAVLEGSGQIQVAGAHHPWRAGDILVLPHGDPHVLRNDAHLLPTGIREAPATERDGLRCVVLGQGPTQTRILCGSFDPGPDGRALLFRGLPPLLHVRGDATVAWLQQTLPLLADELDAARPGASLLVSRLTEVLFLQVLRAWSLSSTHPSWLTALADPGIARALAALHSDPAHPWTADELGRAAGMSRTIFFERFTSLMGEPPTTYLTRWRMHLARVSLEREQASLATVAERVGYTSEAAFSRAFKREVGVSPSEWRRQSLAAK